MTELHGPEVNGRKREPFAVPNLTWVVAIAATFFVLAKIFSVSGLNVEGAMLILRSADILKVLTGILLSDIQVLSFAILLFVAALYMKAEWPIHNRSEREMHVLAAVLLTSWLIVLVVAPWPLALAALVMGLPFVLRKLIRPRRVLAAFGLLNKQRLSKLDDEEKRKSFRENLPGPVIEALMRGDVTSAYGNLTDPPRFAKEELEDLARQYSSTTGIRPLQDAITRYALFIVGIAIFGLLVQPRPWVPPERLSFDEGTTRTGFVIGNEDEMLVVLWKGSGKLEMIDADDVRSRSVCRDFPRYRTLPQLLGWVDGIGYVRCPPE